MIASELNFKQLNKDVFIKSFWEHVELIERKGIYQKKKKKKMKNMSFKTLLKMFHPKIKFLILIVFFLLYGQSICKF